jgi:prenyltransferase beta subunit
MSLRLEMLQVARLAPKVLGESSALVRDFLLGQQNRDGGFKDRTGQSDLYYTVFGIEGLLALQEPFASESLTSFLKSFGDGAGLDFVHLCCLARSWAGMESQRVSGADFSRIAPGLLRRIEAFRAADGGFSPTSGAAMGTAYAAFLGLGAYQDLRPPLPEPLRLVQSLKLLETSDGAWTNERVGNIQHPIPAGAGSTNATAAAIAVLRNLQMPIDSAVGDWLLAQAHPQGGFRAMPTAPIPDLLSTATALHALAGLQISFEPIKESCIDFVDSLWTNAGSFHGHWHEEILDTEYTYYGLLALGHLSL